MKFDYEIKNFVWTREVRSMSNMWEQHIKTQSAKSPPISRTRSLGELRDVRLCNGKFN